MEAAQRFVRRHLLNATWSWKFLFIYAVLVPFLIFSVFPFVWMIITSFKSRRDLYNLNDPFNYPQGRTWEHYKFVLEQTGFEQFVKNSLFVGSMVVVITLLTAVPAAYSLARLAGRWGERVGIGLFMVYLIPPTLLFLPMTRVITFIDSHVFDGIDSQLSTIWDGVSIGLHDVGLRDVIKAEQIRTVNILPNLQNSKWGLIAVYPTFTIPFCTWLLIGFMKAIPKDIEEQALVDGYSRIGALIRVVVPLALPGLITVVVFSFMLTLHEYIYSLAITQASAQKPISLGVTTELILGDVIFWQPLMAAAIMVAIPIAIVYNFFLNRFIEGLTLGAVKG